ncbi:MAG: hypothetical protein R2755_12665 [Acidimicrobiales bacterium]
MSTKSSSNSRAAAPESARMNLLVGDQPPVQRHHDDAQLRAAEERLHELGAVLGQDGDAIALADAQAAQQVTRPVGPVVPLGVGEAAPGGPVDHGLQVRVATGATGQDLTDVHLHGRNSGSRRRGLARRECGAAGRAAGVAW